ncbi:MAG TPA: hypothetical protein VK824_09020 [Planctomycetota bacterium]|nr:hypothetical protein [Planctomycetota bacterium]
MKTTLGLIALATLMTACASDANKEMKKDVAGNYASTSKYNAMEREEFTAAMEAGMRDFDARLASLKVEAEKLGPDAVEEYHGCLDELMEKRRVFAAEVEKHRSMLADDWRKRREHVAETYIDLRESLDEAYDEVVDEA